jgi:hypothetical protein
MAKHKKLLIRFLSKPKDFAYEEMKTLLSGFGYQQLKGGKTSGSRVVFIHDERQHIIRLHKPHPKNFLKRYQLDLIEEELKKRKILK